MNYLTPKQQKWRQVAPCITDFTYENATDWPVTACKWGPVVHECKQYIRQKIYFTIRTDGTHDESSNTWKHVPSQIIVATVDIPQISYSINPQVGYIYQQLQFYKNPSIKIRQLLVHPGESNVMKCNQSKKLIATKNDQNNVFIWDVNKHKAQPNFKDGTHCNVPELNLVGHTSSGYSTALDWAGEHRIASGSKDDKILIWDIADYQTRLSNCSLFSSKRELNNICGSENIKLEKRLTLSGHTNEVLGVSFNQNSPDQLISYDQDRTMICWDQRTESGKAWSLNDVHKEDIHCAEWSPIDEHYIASGAQDGTVHLIDIRKPEAKQEYIRDGYNSQVLCLQFGPDRNHITIGSDELYTLNMWNRDVTFCYYGHKGSINQFDINDKSPWTYLSTCLDQFHEFQGGGQLHMYRLLDLIYLAEEEALEKL